MFAGKRPKVRGRQSVCILEGCQRTAFRAGKETSSQTGRAVSGTPPGCIPIRASFRWSAPVAPADHRLPCGNQVGLMETAKGERQRVACCSGVGGSVSRRLALMSCLRRGGFMPWPGYFISTGPALQPVVVVLVIRDPRKAEGEDDDEGQQLVGHASRCPKLNTLGRAVPTPSILLSRLLEPALTRVVHTSHDSPKGCSRRRQGVLPKCSAHLKVGRVSPSAPRGAEVVRNERAWATADGALGETRPTTEPLGQHARQSAHSSRTENGAECRRWLLGYEMFRAKARSSR